MSPVEEVFALFEANGHRRYHRDAVDLRQHSLQTAALADQAGADASLVVAALLHDVGHLLDTPADDIAGLYGDDLHEQRGAAWLDARFASSVCEPVRWHVAAKRYLCSVEPGYLDRLSPGALHVLAAQGGPLSAERARAFEGHPWFEAAVRLRRWDDAARVGEREVPPLGTYLPHLESVLSYAAA